MIPLPDLNISFTPEEKGVESIARQIKLTGRAYPLFDIAMLVLKKPDRFHAQFSVKKNAEGKIIQPLYICSLDESLWLSEEEVAAHALKNHFATFYQADRVATEPPKGTYTFVAQCGMSGVILGPPNYHDYQNKLRKLHTERFSRMPFEAFKARVKIVKDEAVVKKWVDEQSWKTEYICINVLEPLRFATREEVERHFREVHLPNLIRTVETYSLPSAPQRPIMAPGLMSLLRRGLDEQNRFPLRVATILSQQFAGHGLQFFKVNKTVTHVCVARPRYLDLQETVVSEGVKRIVDFIDHSNNCTRRKLLEALAPTPAGIPAVAPAAPAPAPVAPPAEAGQAPAPAAPAAPVAPPPTPEQTAVITDLHWLVHQGHVIEFADGRMETAKAPKPKPVPAPKAPEPPATPAAPAAPVGAASTTSSPEVSHECQPQPAPSAPQAPVAEPAPAAQAPAAPEPVKDVTAAVEPPVTPAS